MLLPMMEQSVSDGDRHAIEQVLAALWCPSDSRRNALVEHAENASPHHPDVIALRAVLADELSDSVHLARLAARKATLRGEMMNTPLRVLVATLVDHCAGRPHRAVERLEACLWPSDYAAPALMASAARLGLGAGWAVGSRPSPAALRLATRSAIDFGPEFAWSAVLEACASFRSPKLAIEKAASQSPTFASIIFGRAPAASPILLSAARASDPVVGGCLMKGFSLVPGAQAALLPFLPLDKAA
ncbi:hypothetical protein OCUBac02_54480 (plasmid) [Bosea sp. ANAM02]|nr:hypothetical protein OCUBac02_54480 [Bosea sp. ANAM02]